MEGVREKAEITQIGRVWIILVPNIEPCQTRRNSALLEIHMSPIE